MKIHEIAKESFTDVLQWRRYLHENPEISSQEFNTSQYISSVLHSLGVDKVTTIEGTGVVGLINGKLQGDVLAFRADIDALPGEEKTGLPFASKNPGIMHSCGHDVHTACLLGAAKVLSSFRERFNGSVKLIFQPAEENCSGAEMMLKNRVLENPKVDAMIGLHCRPSLLAGSFAYKKGVSCAACDTINIRIYGKQGHGAHPDQCVDSIFIAGHVICALQGLISRELNPLENAVISVCKIEGGKASNIIPGVVCMLGTLRTLDPQVRYRLFDRIKKLTEGVADSFRGEAVVEMIEGIPCLLENDYLVDRFIKVAEEIAGKEHIEEISKPSMGGDDFALYSNLVPSMMFRLGVGFSGQENAPLHSEYFHVNEESLHYGVAALTSFALDYLGNEKSNK